MTTTVVIDMENGKADGLTVHGDGGGGGGGGAGGMLLVMLGVDVTVTPVTPPLTSAASRAEAEERMPLARKAVATVAMKSSTTAISAVMITEPPTTVSSTASGCTPAPDAKTVLMAFCLAAS